MVTSSLLTLTLAFCVQVASPFFCSFTSMQQDEGPTQLVKSNDFVKCESILCLDCPPPHSIPLHACSLSEMTSLLWNPFCSRIVPLLLQTRKGPYQHDRLGLVHAVSVSCLYLISCPNLLTRAQQEEGPSQPVRDEGAYPPPQSLDVSGEEAFARRGRMGATGFSGAGPVRALRCLCMPYDLSEKRLLQIDFKHRSSVAGGRVLNALLQQAVAQVFIRFSCEKLSYLHNVRNESWDFGVLACCSVALIGAGRSRTWNAPIHRRTLLLNWY